MSILHLFPTSGFDRSTVTPVLLGVVVSWLFTETFGWVFAGLVVPGYLAAVFAVDPRAGLVDVAEALFTYGLARLLGEHLSRTGLTSRVFGRERFLLVVISSVLVRLAVEGAILPRFAPHAAGAFFSIGLVVVPLAANACWKTGLARGIVQNGVPTLIVYLLLRFVLVPYTNLSLAGFALATEDIAGSFLASPKAYIILITGAVLAASSNVLDGWDFNGILIPALLALVVVEPTKLIATFVEALLLVGIATLVIRTTPLGRFNIEGPRRLVLFFALDYALRFLVAAIAGTRMSGADVVSVMGFGYLLPTLLAVKIVQTGSAALVLLPTAQVSLGAYALGTIVGFCALLVDSPRATARTSVVRAVPRAPSAPSSAALWAAALARPDPLRELATAPLDPNRVVALIDDLVERPGPAEDDARRANAAGLEAQRLDGGVLLVRERFELPEERWGDPTVLVSPNGRAAAEHVVAFVPAPLHAPETAAIAGALLVDNLVDAVVVAGIEEESRPTVTLELAARGLARALADRRHDGPAAQRGRVVALLGSPDGHTSARGESLGAARVERLLGAVTEHVGAVERKSGGAGKEVDVVIELADPALAKWFPAFAPGASVSLASPAAMALAFEHTRAAAPKSSAEDILATRRLLLDPLFRRRDRGRDLSLLRLGAQALGYRLLGPTRLPDGHEGVVIVPGDEPRPLAVVAHMGGTSRTVMEIPRGHRQGIRDVAWRLLPHLDVDVILLGLGAGESARGVDALRVAHAAATYPSTASATPPLPSIVLLRDAPAEWGNAGVVGIGAWGGKASADPEIVRALVSALAAVDLKSAREPLDPAVREMSGRSIVGDVPLVSATVDAVAQRTLALDDARSSARALSALELPGSLAASDGSTARSAPPVSPAVPVVEGSIEDVAARLAAALSAQPPDDARRPSARQAADVHAMAERAALEGSIVARRALASSIEAGARAALARSGKGDFLVVVSPMRGSRALLLDVVPLDPRAARNHARGEASKTLRDCARAIDLGGHCRAESP